MNLKENRFINEKSLDMNKTYVTDLIKNMDLNVNYNFNPNKDLPVEYEYSIIGSLGSVYTDDGKEYKVWEKDYPLLETKKGTTNGIYNINEKININLEKFNIEVNDFEQTMGMSLDSFLTIKLIVKSKINVEGKQYENKYNSNIRVSLGDKITIVEGKLNEQNSNSIKQTVMSKNNIKVFNIILNLIIMLISIYVFIYILNRTKEIKNIKNEYKLELNRILKACQDKIVKVNRKMEVDNSKTIDVNDFVELIKLSEELFKPILYWNSDDEKEAWFCVISSNVTYRFILKKYE